MSRRVAPWVCAVLLAVTLAGCGLPGEERTQVVDDASVPYDLLGPGTPTRGGAGTDPGASRPAPVVFWLGPDDTLTASTTGLGCDDRPTAVVEQVLATLIAAPTAAQRDAGLSSAIPATARMTLVQVTDGVAEVDLDPVTLSDAERLPLAVGQVVLSVTSAPGVDAVRLVTSGEPVDPPLPSGALATRDVTPEDYDALLPDPPGDGSRQVGCTDSSDMTDR